MGLFAGPAFAFPCGMTLDSIDDVLRELDAIVALSRQRGSADGYFAALYRRTTAEVKARIDRGEFADGPRMTRLDIGFARRYLDAWHACERGEPTSAVWSVAFGCSRDFWPLVLQHLLLGMNAHINLDLGVAAAEVAPGDAIDGLEGDFAAINGVLADMVDEVQTRLARIWPAMRWLDVAGSDVDEAVVNFSIRRARQHAWLTASTLARLPEVARAVHIRNVDATMAALGRRVLNPGASLAVKLAAVRLSERGSVAAKIDALFL
jgi:hypothetical protein